MSAFPETERARVAADHAREAYERLGLHVAGHVIFHSGLHSFDKIECDPLFLPENRYTLEQLGDDLAALQPRDNIECVVGCPDGGTELAKIVGDILGLPSVLPSKADAIEPFSAHAQLVRAALSEYRYFLIADDVFTTGSSVHGMKHLLPNDAVLEVGTIYKRGELQSQFASGIISVRALLELRFTDYEPDACPKPACRLAVAS